jgi:hypothetical protein
MVDAEDKAAVLFSFPYAGLITVIHEICVQVTTIGAGGTPACNIGYGTMATNLITTGGVCVATDDDEYIQSASVTWTTAGYYFPATNVSDYTKLRMVNTWSAGSTLILGAASTTPIIGAWYTDVGTPTQGKFRVHVLISTVPGTAV